MALISLIVELDICSGKFRTLREIKFFALKSLEMHSSVLLCRRSWFIVENLQSRNQKTERATLIKPILFLISQPDFNPLDQLLLAVRKCICILFTRCKGCTLISSFLLFLLLWQLQQKTIMSILNTAALEGDKVGLVCVFVYFLTCPLNSYITLDWTAQCIDLLSISPKSTVICSCQGDKACSVLNTKLVCAEPITAAKTLTHSFNDLLRLVNSAICLKCV